MRSRLAPPRRKQWRGPEVEGEVPTLGWLVIDYAEATFGKVFDADSRDMLLRLFQLKPDAGKEDPFVFGAPIMFDGWDADGEPVARPQ